MRCSASDLGRSLGGQFSTSLWRLPETIAAAEAKLASLDAKLQDPTLWQRDDGEAQRVTDARADAQAEVDRLLARWEELEAIREAQ